MTATQGDLASLSRYVFRAPRWYTSVAFALLVAGVAGAGAFDSRFVLEDAWQGVFFIGVPTVVASLLTTPVDRELGGQLTYNRSSLLALTCEALIVTVMAGAGAVTHFVPGLGQQFVFDALIVGLASVFALRLLVVMAVSGTSVVVAAIPASVQTATAAALFFVYSGTIRYLELGGGPVIDVLLSRPEEAPPELGVIVPVDFALLGIMCAIYGVAVWAFVEFIDRPWKRSLDVSVLDFISGFIGHIAEGTRELEDFFETIGEEAVVPVTVLSFRRPESDADTSSADGDADGTSAAEASDDREKARFVLPMIHPGPMGEIGGGNLPERVALEAEGLAFPPHATAGHDFNLVTEREVDTLIETAREAHENIEYHDTATPSVRVQEGDAKVVGQGFGDDALLVGTFSPVPADDVSYAVGLSAAAEARSAGVEDVMLVDAHNCNDGLDGPDLGHVYPGSERSFEMMQAAGTAGDRLADADREPLRLGVAWDETEWEPRDGIGPLGVRVAVLDAGDHRTAYVLVDGNNMEPGLRDRIVDRLTASDARAETADAPEESESAAQATARADGARVPTADAAEVMTTDTHVVNQVEASNQVGESVDEDELVALVDRLVAEATADLEPVEAGMASERAEVTVFGNDRTETLASHANAVISMGAALAAVVVLAAMVISLLVFLLAGS